MGARRERRFMTGERAKRFPLGLADVRERRRPDAQRGDARASKPGGAKATGATSRPAGTALNGTRATKTATTSASLKPAGSTARVSAAGASTASSAARVAGKPSSASSSAAGKSLMPAGAAVAAKAPAASATPGSASGNPASGNPASGNPSGSARHGALSTGVARAAKGHAASSASSVATHPTSAANVATKPRAATAISAMPPVHARRTIVTAPASAVPKANATVLRAATQPPPAMPLTQVSGAAQQSVANAAQALTSERVRERMVERLRANGVTDARVLHAMSVVPRHLFVDPGLATQAYEDAALPIGHHQTISKPSVVSRMIELAAGGRELANVLEIGTGCGYQAAVLSQVARDVYSIERIKPLYERAKTNLRPLRIPNIRLHYGDGRLGLPAVAPFDAIVIAAAGLDVPQALLEQLAIGGRLVAPVGDQHAQSQVLTLVERVGPAQWRESRLDRVFFVPLKSGVI
jgi:protein-L-isoaspartate(D-aspartate) O-methyltransferase